eukprot:scaffold20170_cov114-Cylindrotheca_fusiformis.AAC.1
MCEQQNLQKYYNQGRGDHLNPLNKGYDNNNNNMFDTVTTEPFGAAILGFFLTYRLPLFVGQVVDAFKEDAARRRRRWRFVESTRRRRRRRRSSNRKCRYGHANWPKKVSSSSSSTATTDGAIMATELTLAFLLVSSGPQSTTGSGPSWSNNCLQEDDDRLVAPTTLVDRTHPGGWDDILND